jgi:hypothetical protein
MNLVPLEKIMWRLLLGAALVLGIALAFAWYTDKQEQSDRESVNVFIKKALLPQLRQWDAQAMRALGTDNFKQLNSIEELRQRLDLYALLGPVVELEAPQQVIHRPWFSSASKPTEAWVSIAVRFRQGDRKLRANLVRTDNSPWRLETITLTP